MIWKRVKEEVEDKPGGAVIAQIRDDSGLD